MKRSTVRATGVLAVVLAVCVGIVMLTPGQATALPGDITARHATSNLAPAVRDDLATPTLAPVVEGDAASPIVGSVLRHDVAAPLLAHTRASAIVPMGILGLIALAVGTILTVAGHRRARE